MSCLSREEKPRTEKRRRRMSAQEDHELFRQFLEYKKLETEVRKLRRNCASRKRKRSRTITISSASSVSSLVSNVCQENRDNKRSKARNKSSHKENVRSRSSSKNRDVTLKKYNHDHTLKNLLTDKCCDHISFIMPKIKKEELEDDSIDKKSEILSHVSSMQDFISIKIKRENMVESSLNKRKELEIFSDQAKPERIERNNLDGVNCDISQENSVDGGKKHEEKPVISLAIGQKLAKTLDNSLGAGKKPAKMPKNSLDKREKHANSFKNPKQKPKEMVKKSPPEGRLRKTFRNTLDRGKQCEKRLKKSLEGTNSGKAPQDSRDAKHKREEGPRQSMDEEKFEKTMRNSLVEGNEHRKAPKNSPDQEKQDQCLKNSAAEVKALPKNSQDKKKLEQCLKNSVATVKAERKNSPDQEIREQFLKNCAAAVKVLPKIYTDEEKHGKILSKLLVGEKKRETMVGKSLKNSPDHGKKTEDMLEKSPKGAKPPENLPTGVKNIEKSSAKSPDKEKKTEETLEKSLKNSSDKGEKVETCPKHSPDEEKKHQQMIASVGVNLREKWLEILKNGLSEELRNEHVQEYPIKENYQFLKAQKLNRLLECSLSEKSIKSDQREMSKQTKIASALIVIDRAICATLSRDDYSEKISETIKFLVDVGKILADLHHSVAMKRRHDVASAFGLGDIADNSPIENFLFSEKVSMILKSAKLILNSSVNDEKEEIDEQKEGKTDEKNSEEKKNEKKMDEKKSEGKNEEEMNAKKSAEKTDDRRSEEETSTDKNSKEGTNINKKSEEKTENSEGKKNNETDSVEKTSIEKSSAEKTSIEKISLQKTSIERIPAEKTSIHKKSSEDKNNNDKESEEKRKNAEEKREKSKEKSNESEAKTGEEKMSKENVVEVQSETQKFFGSLKEDIFKELKAIKEEFEIVYQRGPKTETKIVNTPGPNEPFPGIIEAMKRAYRAKGWPEGAIDTMVNARTISTMKHYERSISYWWDYCKKNPTVDVYDANARQIVQFFVIHEHVIKTHGVLAAWRSAMGDFTSDDLGKDKFVSNYVKGFQVVKTEKK